MLLNGMTFQKISAAFVIAGDKNMTWKEILQCCKDLPRLLK